MGKEYWKSSTRKYNLQDILILEIILNHNIIILLNRSLIFFHFTISCLYQDFFLNTWILWINNQESIFFSFFLLYMIRKPFLYVTIICTQWNNTNETTLIRILKLCKKIRFFFIRVFHELTMKKFAKKIKKNIRDINHQSRLENDKFFFFFLETIPFTPKSISIISSYRFFLFSGD